MYVHVFCEDVPLSMAREHGMLSHHATFSLYSKQGSQKQDQPAKS